MAIKSNQEQMELDAWGLDILTSSTQTFGVSIREGEEVKKCDG
jgi:hypothetical protein